MVEFTFGGRLKRKFSLIRLEVLCEWENRLYALSIQLTLSRLADLYFCVLSLLKSPPPFPNCSHLEYPVLLLQSAPLKWLLVWGNLPAAEGYWFSDNHQRQ